jgi:hypothetical protein
MKKLIISVFIFAFIQIINGQTGLSNKDEKLITRSDSLNNSDLILTPFSNLGNNILQSFSGTDNILLQFAGLASTYLISASNIDSRISTYSRDHDYSNYARPAVIIGQTLPITAGVFLYIYGKLSSDDKMIGASYAVLQSGLITLGYISLLKAITGRAYPKVNDEPSDRSLVSQTFLYGFLRHGVYQGWPSGHTGAAMAVASSLSHFYPDKTWLQVLSYSWVAYTLASVSVNHRGTMHWFSDAVAASFMTYSIGKSVGNFYKGKMEDKQRNTKFQILPVVDSDYTGINLSYTF